MITPADLRGDEPLYRKIGNAILEKIESGELAAGARLPAIRTLAASLGINNATVVSAYSYLEKNRAVFSVRGSGVYVASNERPQPPFSAAHDFRDYINFADTSMPANFFPTEDFRRAFDAVLLRDGAAAFSHLDAIGKIDPVSDTNHFYSESYFPLREKISSMLAANAGISAPPEEICVVQNMRQGLAQILRALVNPGDSVVLESPCAPWAAGAFGFCGAKIHELPLTKDGPDLARLAFLTEKFRPKVFFLSPNFQFPTGLCYTNSAKKKILELAHAANAYIIEVDDYADFFYGEKPVPLKAADTVGRVVYLRGFERVLAPGLVGFVAGKILQGEPCEVVEKIFQNEQCEVSGYIRRGLDWYLRNCDFDAHCAKIRAVYAKRYRRAMAAAETFLSPYADFIAPGGGLGLWISPKNTAANLADKFLARKVIVSPGRFYAPAKPAHEGHFRISFANVNEDAISKGIGIIASVLGEGR